MRRSSEEALRQARASGIPSEVSIAGEAAARVPSLEQAALREAPLGLHGIQAASAAPLEDENAAVYLARRFHKVSRALSSEAPFGQPSRYARPEGGGESAAEAAGREYVGGQEPFSLVPGPAARRAMKPFVSEAIKGLPLPNVPAIRERLASGREGVRAYLEDAEESLRRPKQLAEAIEFGRQKLSLFKEAQPGVVQELVRREDTLRRSYTSKLAAAGIDPETVTPAELDAAENADPDLGILADVLGIISMSRQVAVPEAPPPR